MNAIASMRPDVVAAVVAAGSDSGPVIGALGNMLSQIAAVLAVLVLVYIIYRIAKAAFRSGPVTAIGVAVAGAVLLFVVLNMNWISEVFNKEARHQVENAPESGSGPGILPDLGSGGSGLFDP